MVRKCPVNLQISAEPAINAAQGKTGVTVTTDYRGKDVMAAYTYIAKTGWGFVCKQDKSELNVPIRKMTLNFIFIFGLITVIISVISFYISKSISKPIVELGHVSQKVKAGDYSVRNEIKSEDELGLLAQALNSMAVAIELKIEIQKGVTDISKTMIVQSTMQQFGSELLKQLMKTTDANLSVFYILNEATSEYEHFTSVGANKELLNPFNAENSEGEIGNALSTKSIYYLRDIPEDTIFKYRTTAGEVIPKEIITIPLVVENSVVALISLVSIQKFSKECFDILKNSWTNINTSYSNLIAGERTTILAEYLSGVNQQLEAQTEELQDQSEELQDQAEELQRTSEELQEQNIELEAQRNQVEAANKLKSEFLSNMSHELRTPLNSIMALSRVLIMQAKDKLNDDENNYLEIVERNGKRLLSLINDILDLSKIEAGKMEVLPNFVSLPTLLQIIKENLHTLTEEKGLSLTLSVPDNLPKIETDESKLYQILTNIIGNAVKFTEKGKVNISVKHDSQNIFIEVKDTGIGISRKVLPYIFDEFRQADGTASRHYEGTGLGLAIANKITKILGGNITVKSKLNKGSVFLVTLPIKWHEDFVLAETFNNEKKSPEATVPKANADNKVAKEVSKTRILIVEDNQDTIIQIKTVLENENYKVDVAGGGQEALDYIQQTIPDGIILDIMMPDVDGFDVLEKLQNTEETKRIPVLILTAKDLTNDDLKKLNAYNIQHFILKGDVDSNDLLNMVKLMLGNKPKKQVKKTVRPLSDEKLKRKHKKRKEKLSDLEKRNIKSSARESDFDFDLPSVLIVEDNPDNMVTVRAILKGKYNIVEAVDGKKGLKLAQSQLPDVILLDMSLPNISGDEIIKKLKKNNETKKIPLIAVTAQAMKGDMKRFIKAGCDGYISKPIDPEALLTEIDRLLV